MGLGSGSAAVLVVEDEPLASPIHEAGILGCSDCVQPIAV